MSRALKATEKEREDGERELSSHVVTRFYRAPEVILMDKNYNKKIDIWAIGAIFCEVLQMKQENLASHHNRKVMFFGKSCAPLSPSKKKMRKKSTNSQMFSEEKKAGKKSYGVTEKDQMN